MTEPNQAVPTPGPLRPDVYGESFAEVYDEWYADVTDAEATARFVAERCGTGPVLELGVGTGRLALPMARLGLDVVGLDASLSMLSRVPTADPGVGVGVGAVHLVQADMAAPPLRGCFGAVLVAFNTLFNLPSAGLQQTMFHRLRPLVAADGVVIIEVLNVDALDSGPRRSVGVRSLWEQGVTVVGTNLDPDAQTILGQHIELTDSGIHRRPWMLRWSHPSQIDAFAELAGFEAVEHRRSWTSSDGAGPPADRGEPPADGTSILVYRPGP